MLTVTTEPCKEKHPMGTKMSPSLQNITPSQEVSQKIQQTNRSTDLWLTYLQQFQQYPLPLVPLKPLTPKCQSQQPSQPKYNPVPQLEVQAHQEEDCQEAEEDHQEVEEEAHQEADKEEAETFNQPNKMENQWAHYQWFLREIALKLRASSENSPHTS